MGILRFKKESEKSPQEIGRVSVCPHRDTAQQSIGHGDSHFQQVPFASKQPIIIAHENVMKRLFFFLSIFAFAL